MKRVLGIILIVTMGLAAEPSGAWSRSVEGGTVSAPAKKTPIQLDVPPVDSPPTPADPRDEKTLAQKRKRRQLTAKLQGELIQNFKSKKYAQAKLLAEQIVEREPDDGFSWYNLAFAHSRLNQKNLAIQTLNIALEMGYTGIRHMERDPDLENLRKLDAFKKLLARRVQIQRRRAERIAETLRKRFGSDYLIRIDHEDKIVFATNTDEATLKEVQADLTRQAKALWKQLFEHRFERYVTIIIPKPGSVKMGIAAGVFRPADATLVARRIGMTLRHEFTHALHFADIETRAQRHPIWVLEGLASLFETSEYQGDTLVPKPNQRLNAIQYYLKKKKCPPLEEFLKFNQAKFMKNPGLSYGMCRYLMMYIHHNGKLRDWYDTYTAGYDADSTGRAALEKTFGKKLDEIDKDWRAWIKTLTAPKRFVPANHAYMGIRTQPDVEGLKILMVVPESGAEKSGLKSGDLITQIDGVRLADTGELLRLVNAKKVGDKLPVRYRREGWPRVLRSKASTGVGAKRPAKKSGIARNISA